MIMETLEMAPQKSSVTLKSNIYPVTSESPYHDEAFIKSIHDPELLKLFDKKFKGRYQLSPLQNKEREFAIHCHLAAEGDYPWGTIEGGQLVCLCENYNCEKFHSCRPKAIIPEISIANNVSNTTQLETLEQIDKLEVEDFNKHFFSNLNTTSGNIKYEEGQSAEISLNIEAIEKTLAEYDNTVSDEIDFELDFDLGEVQQETASETETVSEVSKPKDISIVSKATSYKPSSMQFDVIGLPSNNRTIINAGPGTGKTFTLIEKLKYMLQEQSVPADEILVLSFSRAAINVIENRLMEAVNNGQLNVPWQDIDIRTFDKFATWILYSAAEIKPESIPEAFILSEDQISKSDYDARIMHAVNLINNWNDLFKYVSHVFIDETQDLVGSRAKLVLAILNSLPEKCGFTILGDSCQAIYDYELIKRKNYQKESQDITSAEMIYEISSKYLPAQFEFNQDYRTKGQLNYSLDSLRVSLINEDVSSARMAIAEIINLQKENIEDIREVNKPAFEEACSNGSLAILTRTNGEALYISSLLRNKSVTHTLHQANREEFLSRLLADIFFDYSSDTISKDEFIARAAIIQDGSTKELIEAWDELTILCRNQAMGSRYRVEDLLQAASQKAKRSSLFVNDLQNNNITISTIHSAKGCEYDNVWLAIEDLNDIADRGDLSECKVAYVALSRPKKCLRLKHFKTAKKILQFPDIGGKRRHFYVGGKFTSRNSKRKIKPSSLEIINEIDVDFSSYGNDTNIQSILKNTCMRDDPISLIRNSTATQHEFPSYSIYLDSDEGNCLLGSLRPSFSKSYAIATSAINGGKKNTCISDLCIDDCPESFDNLHIGNIVSYIGSSAEAPRYAKRFGNKCIWYGATISGLAKANSRSY